MPDSNKYQETTFPVRHKPGFFMPTLTVEVCNLCGAVVGNKPAHDVFCYSTEGEREENHG